MPSGRPLARTSERRVAAGFGLVLTLLVLMLDTTYYRHAGPLWRDEVNSVNVTARASLRDVFAVMHRDSFPAAWPAVLYAWQTVGLGTTDAALRALGLVIAAGFMAALWWTGWQLGIGPPLVALLIVGMSPTSVIYGTEVRGYGLAALAIAWCVGALWAFARRPTLGRYLVALAATTLAAQTHYLNCVLLVAVGASAGLVCAKRRDRRAVLLLASIGAIAAASVVVLNFTALTYMVGTTPLEQGDWGVRWLGRVLAHALAPGAPVLAALWVLAGVAAAVGLVLAWWRPRAPGDDERALYVATSAAATPPLALLAIAQGGVASSYWYYLSVMVVLAVAVDVGTTLLASRFTYGRWIRFATIALGAVLALPAVVKTVTLRMTNLDLVADAIAAKAAPGDLVVVFPWVSGITFQRYYRGTAPWITWPDFEEHVVHSHDRVADKMKLGEAAIRPELARVEETLRRGNAVWVAGHLTAPDRGHSPPPLPPAPTGPRGWRAAPYLNTWEMRLGELLEAHAVTGEVVPLPEVGPINAWEKLPLTRVVGWR